MIDFPRLTLPLIRTHSRVNSGKELGSARLCLASEESSSGHRANGSVQYAIERA